MAFRPDQPRLLSPPRRAPPDPNGLLYIRVLDLKILDQTGVGVYIIGPDMTEVVLSLSG